MRAAIDIGSNTVLLLVGAVQEGKVEVMYEAQHAPRLGRKVDAKKNLDPDSVARVVKVLKEYKTTLQEHYPGVEQVRVVATSAVRDAKNRQSFLERVKEETGYDVQVASGEQEARLTYRGAQSVLEDYPGEMTVLDIGGGSTEIATGSGRKMADRFSFDIGSVRFTERYLKTDPPSQRELQQCRHAIAAAINERSFELSVDTKLIGVAGTVTSLASILLDLEHYEPEQLNRFRIALSDISAVISRFSKMKAEGLLQEYPVILEGREDVILGGLLVLEGFMQQYDMDELTVSTGGIRHGAIIINN